MMHRIVIVNEFVSRRVLTIVQYLYRNSNPTSKTT